MSFAEEITKAVSQPVVLIHVDSVDGGYAGRFATTEFTPIGASVPYEGRLFSLPAIASSRDLQFFGILKYSSSGITLINSDGDLDTLLEDYNILGAKVRIYYGFKDMDISTFVNIYTGYVEAATVSETYANLTVSDRRKIFDTEIDDFWVEIDALTVIKDTILLANTNVAFNDTYFDTTAWNAAAAVAPDLTIWADEPLKHGDQIISGASLSAFGNVTIESDGRYSFRYINQGQTAVTTIKKADIMNEYSIVYDSSEVISSVIVLSGLQEDLSIEDYGDLSRDTTREASVYASTGIYREQKFQTYLPTTTAAASFATDILDYYCGIHGKLSVTVPMAYYAIEIGQVVEAEIDRLNSTMLGTVDCEVLGKVYNLDNNTIDFELRITDIPARITPQIVSVTPLYKATDNTYAEAVEAAIPTTAPKYIGRYTGAHPTANYGDWWLLYGTSGSAITRGVYYDLDGTPVRVTTSSATILQGKLVEALPDVAWAEANSFGSASDYGIDNFFTNIAAVTALIQSLFAQYIKVETGGSIIGGDRYGTAGTVIDSDEPGIYIGADGTTKMSGRLESSNWVGTDGNILITDSFGNEDDGMFFSNVDIENPSVGDKRLGFYPYASSFTTMRIGHQQWSGSAWDPPDPASSASSYFQFGEGSVQQGAASPLFSDSTWAVISLLNPTFSQWEFVPAPDEKVNLGASSYQYKSIYISDKIYVGGTQVISSQQATVADASANIASVTAQLNSLLAKLRTHGLIDT